MPDRIHSLGLPCRNIRTLSWLSRALLFTLIFSVQRSEGKVIDRIVAIVNREVITLSELREKLRPLQRQLNEIRDPLQREQTRRTQERAALNSLIGELLILQEARRQGLQVSNAQVESHIQRTMQQQGWSDAQLSAYLQAQQMSRVAFEAEIRRQLLKQQLTRQQLASRLQVSDQDVEQGYRDYLSRVRSQVQVEGAHLVLLVPPGATPAQEASVRQRAAELLARIRGGEDFSAVTRSEGEGAGAGGDGYLGFITRGGGLPRALEDAFLELDEGEVGGPVRSPFGYHVVRAIKLHQVTAKSLEEMRPQLQQELRQGRFVKAFSEWVEELKQRAFIEEKL
ncbi:MAG: SurA N-terminal domain-containing protein [Myxococcota bacterium]|nr:SurA N-terminal domain-containing protein [Myxococcota bacterium]